VAGELVFTHISHQATSSAREQTIAIHPNDNRGTETQQSATDFDAFNRKIKEQHTGFDGRKIISDIHYDDLGRVKQASLN
jgi:hypothetical protein